MTQKSDIKTKLEMINTQHSIMLLLAKLSSKKNKVTELLLTFHYAPLLNFTGRKFHCFHRTELWHIVDEHQFGRFLGEILPRAVFFIAPLGQSGPINAGDFSLKKLKKKKKV